MNLFLYVSVVVVSFVAGYLCGKYLYFKASESDVLRKRYERSRWH